MSKKEPQSGDAELQELVFPVGELIQAREASGRSQEDVAQELRLSLRYIQALETAEFDQLPSMVFARGYVQSYTKLLDLDADRYLAIFDEIVSPGTKQRRSSIRSIGKVDQQAKSGDFAVKSFTWILLLALVGVSVWWWKTQSNPELLSDLLSPSESVETTTAPAGESDLRLNIDAEPEVDSFPPVEVEPVSVPVTEQADEVLANAEAVLEAAAETASEASAEEAEVSNDTPVTNLEPVTAITAESETELAAAQVDQPVAEEVAPETTPVVAETAATAPGVGRLLIDFVDDCWISVKDVNGQVLAMRIKPAGSKLDVSGPGPLKIQIGKVSAVETISFNGQPVDLSSYTRLDVAKLSLPASE